MKAVVQDAIAKTPEVVNRLRGILPAGFPAQVADSILDGISARAEQLAMELRHAP
jgi:serine/threonine-protein kinase HipA